jgi:hypothetical protein
MPIWHFQTCNRLGLQEQGLLNVAYRRALAALHLVDHSEDPQCEMVARKIKQVYERGVRNPYTLSIIAVGELRNIEVPRKFGRIA